MRRLGAINVMSVGIFGAAVVLFVYLILIRPTLPQAQVGQDQVMATATVDAMTQEWTEAATDEPTESPTVTTIPTATSIPALERIAFTSSRDGGEDAYLDIYTMNPDGSDVERLTHTNEVAEIALEWSDDGNALLYISGLYEHMCVSLMGKHGEYTVELYDILDFEGSIFDIDAALPSKTFAYLNKDYDLYLTSPEMPPVLIRSDVEAWSSYRNTVLSEDGRALAYINESYELEVVYLDQVNQVRSLNQDQFSNMATPAWSPDGAQIAFSAQTVTEDKMYLWVAALGENIIRQITYQPMDIRYVSWSPDAQYLAFYAYDEDSGTTGLYVIQSDGSNLRRIATLTDPLSMSWSPNSLFIAVDTVLEIVPDYYNIQVAAVDGSGVTTLTEGEHDSALPLWSPRP